MDFPNVDLLESAAEKLRPLLSEIVFVGGCATGLLISDPGGAPVRRTYDVDVISEIASYADYAVFSAPYLLSVSGTAAARARRFAGGGTANGCWM